MSPSPSEGAGPASSSGPQAGATDAEPYSSLAADYDTIVIDDCHGRWARFVHELWQADSAGVATVLDLGCGTGLMVAELAALGYTTVGVDASAEMLARARARLGPGASLFERRLPDLSITGVFDAAVSTFDSLNYLDGSTFRSTIAAVGQRLRAGGWLVFDLHTDAMMDFTVANPVVEGSAHGREFVISTVVDVEARTCDTRIQLSGGQGDTFSEKHRQYFHSDEHVRAALAEAHFVLISVTDEYSANPVGDASLRATWTARRVVD